MFLTLIWIVLVLFSVIFVCLLAFFALIHRVLRFFMTHYGIWQSWETIASNTRIPNIFLVPIINAFVNKKLVHKRKDQKAYNDELKDFDITTEHYQEMMDGFYEAADDTSMAQAKILRRLMDRHDQLRASFLEWDPATESTTTSYSFCEYRMIDSGRRRKKRWFRFSLPWETDLVPA